MSLSKLIVVEIIPQVNEETVPKQPTADAGIQTDEEAKPQVVEASTQVDVENLPTPLTATTAASTSVQTKAQEAESITQVDEEHLTLVSADSVTPMDVEAKPPRYALSLEEAFQASQWSHHKIGPTWRHSPRRSLKPLAD